MPAIPAQTIMRVAKDSGYDLLVMGHRGHSHSRVWGTFMGTMADGGRAT
jgi:nucleotide-binding universal stress UspA family protein